MTTFFEKDRDTTRVHILLAEDDPGIAAALQSFFCWTLMNVRALPMAGLLFPLWNGTSSISQ